MQQNSGKGPISEINVTPLVDVMLVLLVIFMITAPMLFNQVDLKLPKTVKSKGLKLSNKKLILSISKTGEYFIGKDKVLFKEIPEILKNKSAKLKDQTIYIQADFALKYEIVAKLMSFLKSKNFIQIALVTEVTNE